MRIFGHRLDGSVVQWLGRRSCDSTVVSLISGRHTIGRLVLEWVTGQLDRRCFALIPRLFFGAVTVGLRVCHSGWAASSVT